LDVEVKVLIDKGDLACNLEPIFEFDGDFDIFLNEAAEEGEEELEKG
jgi:hypothetical protein